MAQGAQGLQINTDSADLHRIVSAGLVTDTPLQNGKEWTLGGYV